MHTFISSPRMAQMVASDLIEDDIRRAEVRRVWRPRRRVDAATGTTAEASALETGPPRWRVAKALHLAH
jgi:hypothetical protein